MIASTLHKFPVTGGETYHIAAAVPTDALGDVLVYSSLSQSTQSRAVPGNLLREPSWEGTAILEAQYWKTSGGIGGAVNEPGGCDGTTRPTLGGGSRIWQEIATVPGWSPYRMITNVTSTATFTDVAQSGSAQVFYRSRILD